MDNDQWSAGSWVYLLIWLMFYGWSAPRKQNYDLEAAKNLLKQIGGERNV